MPVGDSLPTFPGFHNSAQESSLVTLSSGYNLGLK